MSSIYEHLVVETARSLGSSSSSEDVGTCSPSDKASRKRFLARINADEARLIAEGRPWYEVRASLLQESDKAIIRDLSGPGLGGELSRMVSNAREVARSSRRSLDEVITKHDKLMREIGDVRGASDADKRSLSNNLDASEASVARLQVEMKRMQEETEEKIKSMQEEAEATWRKRKEDFLNRRNLISYALAEPYIFSNMALTGAWPNLGPTVTRRPNIQRLSSAS
ncbi:hypothetical protein F511_03771 [Dorcoceras hygrometricum]|uniref:Uncharacterized protein n=1 Tax=Dorcoceras hygrometricum TaxID=472368 RepID=A0A2Z7BC46_9LAMI|nr:hypothetical protein F511_03771 [Dorcoceras hygrometricum]